MLEEKRKKWEDMSVKAQFELTIVPLIFKCLFLHGLFDAVWYLSKGLFHSGTTHICSAPKWNVWKFEVLKFSLMVFLASTLSLSFYKQKVNKKEMVNFI